MKVRSVITISAVLIALAAVVSVLGTRRVAAVNPQPLPPQEFGMVGLTAGQTARIFVTNAADSSGNPCGQGSGGPTLVLMMEYLDITGTPIMDPTTGNPVQSAVTLAPCTSAFLDLDADRFMSPTSASGGRLEVRAVVVGETSGGEPGDRQRETTESITLNFLRRPILASLEVFDKATGRTSIHIDSISQPTGPAQ